MQTIALSESIPKKQSDEPIGINLIPGKSNIVQGPWAWKNGGNNEKRTKYKNSEKGKWYKWRIWKYFECRYVEQKHKSIIFALISWVCIGDWVE